MMKNPRFLLACGLVLMFSGILIPFLMIIKILETTYFLSFLSWGISTLGLALGTIGFTMWNHKNKR